MREVDERTKEGTRKKLSINQPFFETGKLQPQAIDLEQAVLGALMLEKDALTNVIDILKPQSFYREDHSRIFTAIQSLFQRSEPVDILTVTNELKKTGELDLVGGPFYITQLTSRVASAANVEFHARIIAEKFIQRELIRTSTETIKMAYEDGTDVFELLDKAEQNLFSILEGNLKKNYDKMSTLMNQALKNIEEARSKGTGVTGVPSGFTELDRLTSGWQPSDLLILAARPGMGKTAFVLSLARNAAVQFKRGVAIFSLEMSSIQLVQRLMSAESELSGDKLRKGQLEDYEYQQLDSKTKHLAEAPLFIDDTPGLSVFELRAKARRLKENHNIQMIIIDYLQLMSAGGDNKGNREQEISQISRSLKMLAKELSVPVIALSQLSRAVETRGGDKKPLLSDLRESGSIEQDADMVMFIYRPEYYGITEDADGRNVTGIAEIIIAKNRHGALKNVPLRFIDRFAKFADLEQDMGMGNFDSPEGGGGGGTYDASKGLDPNPDFNIRTFNSKMNSDNHNIEEDPF